MPTFRKILQMKRLSFQPQADSSNRQSLSTDPTVTEAASGHILTMVKFPGKLPDPIVARIEGLITKGRLAKRLH
jgi:hypothetical protein